MKLMQKMFLACAAMTMLFGCGGGGGAAAPAGVSGTGKVVMAPVYSATVKFIGSDGKTMVFNNMSTQRTTTDGTFTMHRGATRIIAAGGVYVDPASGTVTTGTVLDAPGEAANVTALTTIVAQSADPTAAKAKIAALGGGSYDDALSTVTASNQKMVQFAEGVGAAIQGVQAAAGFGNMSTAMKDFSNQMQTLLATATSNVTTSALQTATQTAASSINAVQNSNNASTLTAALNNQIAQVFTAVGLVNPGATGANLPTVDPANLATGSTLIQAALAGNIHDIVTSAASTQQAVVSAASTAAAKGGDLSNAVIAAQSAAQAALQSQSTASSTTPAMPLDLGALINNATTAAMAATVGLSSTQISAAAQAAAISISSGDSTPSNLTSVMQAATTATSTAGTTGAQGLQAAMAAVQASQAGQSSTDIAAAAQTAVTNTSSLFTKHKA